MNSDHSKLKPSRYASSPEYAEFKCVHCGNSFPAEDRLLLADMTVCDRCSDEYALCADCNAWILSSALDEEQSCDHCRAAAVPIRAYGYKPQAVFCGEDSKLFLGLELELNIEDDGCDLAALAGRLLQMLPYAYAKKDRSIPRGFELVTHPATLSYHNNIWLGVADAWNAIQTQYRFCCADKTGMHVHLSKAFFSPLQLARLLYFVNHQNNLQFLTLIAQRPLRHWTRREKLGSEAGSIKMALAGQYDRFRVLNCNPVDTVELRLFNGSSLVGDILKNLQFASALGNWIKQIDNRQCGDYRHFIDWLDEQNAKTGEFQDLLNFLCKSAYRISGLGQSGQ